MEFRGRVREEREEVKSQDQLLAIEKGNHQQCKGLGH
jgi:hypothetical protein